MKTPVIFRKFKDGDVIAIFPTLPGTNNPNTCGSYQHIGQHGACSLDIVSITKLAQWEDYADLYRELQSIGYSMKVYNRIQPEFRSYRLIAIHIN